MWLWGPSSALFLTCLDVTSFLKLLKMGRRHLKLQFSNSSCEMFIKPLKLKLIRFSHILIVCSTICCGGVPVISEGTEDYTVNTGRMGTFIPESWFWSCGCRTPTLTDAVFSSQERWACPGSILTRMTSTGLFPHGWADSSSYYIILW